MTLTGILTTAIILSSGMTVPNSDLVCGVDINGAYVPSIKQIYICEGADDFTIYHEYGHHVYFNLISNKARLKHSRMYWKHRDFGYDAFYREYSYYDSQEDWADLYSLIMLKENSNPYAMKRMRLIRSLLQN